MSLNIGIVAPTPGSKKEDTGHIATEMMVGIFKNVHDEIHIFTRDTFSLNFKENNVVLHKLNKPFAEDKNTFRRLSGHIIYQCRIAGAIIKKRENLDLIVFGGWGQVIPLFMCKILGIKSIQRVGGHPERVEEGRLIQENKNSYSITSKLRLKGAKLIANIGYKLADYIIVISDYMIKYNNLESFSHKVLIWNHYYFDLEKFRPIGDFNERENIIGFIGIVNQDKGIPELIEAFIQLKDVRPELKLLIIGDGPYLPTAKKKIEESGLKERVEFTGSVNRDQIPFYLNRIKLFVLPSKHEGLPKVVIEAMACGTPVIASNVGGIQDIIKDGETGFIIDRGTSRVVTKNIEFVLNNSTLEEVAKNARLFVEREYTYEASLVRWKKIVEHLSLN